MTNFDFNIDGKNVAINTNTEEPKKAKAKVKGKAIPEYSRSFSLSSYIDPDALLCFLRRCAWVQHFALAHHDKDNKEPHTHVILYTYSAKTSSAVKKNFDRFSKEYYKDKGEPQNTLCEFANDVTSLWRYLIHADDPDKYQYDPSIRKTDSLDYWQKYEKTDGLNDSSNNFGLAMFEEMLNGASTREMILKYGKEYIYHARYLKEVVADHKFETETVCDYLPDYNKTIIKDTIAFKKHLCECLGLCEGLTMKSIQDFEILLTKALAISELADGVHYSIVKFTENGEVIK